MVAVEQLETLVRELQERAKARVVELAWQAVRGHPPAPDELCDAMTKAGMNWADFRSILAAATEASRAAQDMVRVADAEKELADIRPKLADAMQERDKMIEKAERKVQSLSDMVAMLEATIRQAKQSWDSAKWKWPGPLGDCFRQAVQRTRDLQSDIAQHEAKAKELDEMVAARRAYARAADATACREAARQADELAQKADAVRAEIERLRAELAEAEAEVVAAEQRLLQLAATAA